MNIRIIFMILLNFFFISSFFSQTELIDEYCRRLYKNDIKRLERCQLEYYRQTIDSLQSIVRSIAYITAVNEVRKNEEIKIFMLKQDSIVRVLGNKIDELNKNIGEANNYLIQLINVRNERIRENLSIQGLVKNNWVTLGQEKGSESIFSANKIRALRVVIVLDDMEDRDIDIIILNAENGLIVEEAKINAKRKDTPILGSDFLQSGTKYEVYIKHNGARIAKTFFLVK